MSSIMHPFSMAGEAKLHGHRIKWDPLPHLMAVAFFWKGHHFTLTDLTLLQNGFRAVEDMALHCEGKRTMASPGFIGSNQLGGPNGLSRQTAQAVSSNPYQAQPGGGGNALANQAITAQQQHAAMLAAQQGILSGGPYQKRAEPLKTEGFRCGEIMAWRGWRVTPQGFLRSMSANVVWGPGEPMDGKTKSTEEHCGVYAYKKLRDFLKAHENDLEVYGQVALWGDVIEHELGYRAEFAKIISLDAMIGRGAGHSYKLAQLRERYQLQ